MDLLSRLLSLVPVTGALDVRCHFGAPWRLEKPEGAHNEIAYHVLLSGHAVVDDGHGTPWPLLPGDIVLFPGGGAHSLHDGSGRKPKPTRHRQAEHLTIAENKGSGEAADVLCGRFFLGTGSTRLLRDYMPGQLVVHSAAQADAGGIGGAEDAASTRLARLIQLMREEAADERPGSASLVNHFSAALFALTLRFASQAAEAPRGLLALAQRPRLQPAIAAMFDTPGAPWNLPDLAALCHMSRATFARHFEDAIGRSASEVLTEIRMTLAARKLAQTSLPVAAIGEQVGYQSEAAFQRIFKRYHGITPAKWRSTQARAPSAPDAGNSPGTGSA